ncbi:MAG: DUF6482 family protein [Pseudomonadales bacterium]
MMLRDLQALTDRGAHPTVEVHAISPMSYLLFVVDHDRRTPVVDHRGATLRFRSRYAAQQALRGAGIRVATFVHRSAYGEMVGMTAPGEQTELRETIDLREP